jgi:carboxylesterase
MAGIDRMVEALAGTRLIAEARPFRLEVSGAKEAVLLLHGYTGNPRELATLGSSLAQAGYTVLAPRYPGHGTNRRDFLASSAEDWLRRALDSYLDLAADHGRVHVLGHSMGGLIATIVAAVFKAPKLLLLAPAFEFPTVGVALAPLIAPFRPVIRRGRPLAESETDPVRRRMHADYWSDDLVSGLAQLHRLLRRARRDLPLLGSDILVVAGERDDVVLPTVGSYVQRRARAARSVEAATIAGAGHLFPFDADAENTALLVREWMGRT